MTQRLLLIGGGHSHVEVIRRWGLAPEAGASMTLISPERHTPYSGMLPGHIAGHYSHAECHIDLDALCARAGVVRIAATASLVDFANRVVCCDPAPAQPFDVLSIDTGSTPVLAPIPGADRHGVPIKPVERFLDQWAELRATARDNAIHVAVVGAGAAGVEVALAMQHRIAQDRGRARFTLISDGPTILGTHPPAVRRRFTQVLDRRGIALHLNAPVERAEAGVLWLHNGDQLACDEVIWVTGAAAPPWPRASGLKTDAAGFIAVDSHLQSLSHPGVFASGDIASMLDTPHPKSGVYAVRQGPPLAANLRRALRAEPLLTYRPQARALALISTGDRYAVASYGPFSLSGAWVWRWKNHVDTRFMRRYSSGE